MQQETPAHVHNHASRVKTKLVNEMQLGGSEEDWREAKVFAREYLCHAVTTDHEEEVAEGDMLQSLKTMRIEMTVYKVIRHALYSTQLYQSGVDDLRKVRVKNVVEEWMGKLPPNAILLPSKMICLLKMLANGGYDKAKSRLVGGGGIRTRTILTCKRHL